MLYQPFPCIPRSRAWASRHSLYSGSCCPSREGLPAILQLAALSSFLSFSFLFIWWGWVGMWKSDDKVWENQFLPSIMRVLRTELSSSVFTAGAFTCLLAPLASFIMNLKCPLLHSCSPKQSGDGASGGIQGNCFPQP